MIYLKKFDETKDYIILSLNVKENKEIKISDIGFKFDQNKLIIYFDKFLNKNFNYVLDNIKGNLNNKGYKIKKSGRNFIFTFKKLNKGKWNSLFKEENFFNTKNNNNFDELNEYNLNKYLDEKDTKNDNFSENDLNYVVNNNLKFKYKLEKKNNKSSNAKTKASNNYKNLSNNKKHKKKIISKRKIKLKNFNQNKCLKDIKNSLKEFSCKKIIKVEENEINSIEIQEKSNSSIKNKSFNENKENLSIKKEESFFIENNNFDKNKIIHLKKNSLNNLKFNILEEKIQKHELKLIDNINFLNKENKLNDNNKNMKDYVYNTFQSPNENTEIDDKNRITNNINNDIENSINLNYYVDKIKNQYNLKIENKENFDNKLYFIKEILQKQDYIINDLIKQLNKEKKGRLKTEEQISRILYQTKNNN